MCECAEPRFEARHGTILGITQHDYQPVRLVCNQKDRFYTHDHTGLADYRLLDSHL
jgi:hypothetical protein